MSDHLVPGDEGFHDDKQLMADLSALNAQLSRYVLRYLDGDALRTRPVSETEEWALVQALRAMADQLEARATRRTSLDILPALDGDAILRRQITGRPSERG